MAYLKVLSAQSRQSCLEIIPFALQFLLVGGDGEDNPKSTIIKLGSIPSSRHTTMLSCLRLPSSTPQSRTVARAFRISPQSEASTHSSLLISFSADSVARISFRKPSNFTLGTGTPWSGVLVKGCRCRHISFQISFLN